MSRASNEIQYTRRNYAAVLSDGHQVDRTDMRFAGDQFCGAVQQRGFPSLPFTRAGDVEGKEKEDDEEEEEKTRERERRRVW